MATTDTAISFWDFTLEINQKKPMQDALIWLHDGHDFSINLLLFCCWYGATGQGRLSKNDLIKLHQASHLWHQNTVLPLRRLCQQLEKQPKIDTFDIREALRAEQIAAEKAEQLMLANTIWQTSQVLPIKRRILDVCKNYATLAQYSNTRLNTTGQQHIIKIIKSCFSRSATPKLIQRCLHILNSRHPITNHDSTHQLPLKFSPLAVYADIICFPVYKVIKKNRN